MLVLDVHITDRVQSRQTSIDEVETSTIFQLILVKLSSKLFKHWVTRLKRKEEIY